MLFPQQTLGFNPDWSPQRPIRLGEKMGNRPA
jgi:phosphatidylserine decarboxylase